MPTPESGDTMRVFCQACGRPMVFAAHLVGRRARCLGCGQVFTIPAVQATPELPVTAPAPPTQVPAGQPAPAAARAVVRRAQFPDIKPEDKPFFAGVEAGVSGPGLSGAQVGGPSTAHPELTQAGESQPAARGGFLLFMEGLLYTGALAIALVLLFRFIPWGVALWLLLPPAAVFGRKVGVHLVFLLTAGGLRLPG